MLRLRITLGVVTACGIGIGIGFILFDEDDDSDAKIRFRILSATVESLRSECESLRSQNAYLRSVVNKDPVVQEPVRTHVPDRKKHDYGWDKRMGDSAYLMYLRGASRHQIANKMGASYVTVCRAIKKRSNDEVTLFD